MLCLPAPSSFSLVAARLGWAQQDCALVTLHGRPLEKIIPHLQDGAQDHRPVVGRRHAAKTGRAVDEARFRRLAAHRSANISAARKSASARVWRATFLCNEVAALNTVALDLVADRDARILPRAPGLPDDFFEHDGQITKREFRALTLSALAPRRGELLWDIGAGSGSVAIEFMLADEANSAIAIEANSARAQRIGRNALALGTPGLRVVEGPRAEGLAGLPRPEKIFIGGGATAPGVIEAALDATLARAGFWWSMA